MAARPARRRVLAGGLAVIVAAAAAVGIALSRPGAPQTSTGDRATTTTLPAPITVSTISPAAGSTGVSLTSAIDVTFSSPVAPSSPMPVLDPAVAGTWSRPAPRVLRFTPANRFLPAQKVTVTVPAGSSGVISVAGASLAASYGASFTTATVPTLRTEQLLAELDYLPVSFVPEPAATAGHGGAGIAMAAATSPSALAAEATSADLVSLDPAPGHFVWRFAHIPSQLAAQWHPGTDDVIVRGAVMAFEAAHGLAPDGIPGPKFFGALLQAVAQREVTSRPYDYVLVTETVPETLYLWSDGRVILQSAANTGVSGAETELGTWPVYLRYTSTTMSGTNPDGSHYRDPGVPWVSYFNGSDAVHGFDRPMYGVPQSDGCVELPIGTAERVYPYDDYGTLVTVTTGALSPELGAAPPSELGAPPTTTTTTAPTTTTTTLAPRRPDRPAPTTTTTPSVPTTTVPPGPVTTTTPAPGATPAP